MTPVHVDDYAVILEPLLGPGERVVDVPGASYVVGPETIEDPADPEHATDTDRLRLVTRTLARGEAVLGAKSSQAVTLRAAILEEHLGGADGDLVVTDRRLLVIDKPIAGAALLWECPRTDIKVAKVTSGIGYAGRIVVVFSDGSGIALLLGILFKGHAVRLVAELNRDADPALIE